MSREQRIQAYSRKYRQDWRDHVAHGGGNFYMHMAQKFKLPIREIREILGKTPPRDPFPNHLYDPCVDEDDGRCAGRMRWYWDGKKWDSRCRNHYPGWRSDLDRYGEDYAHLMEEQIQRFSR